MQWGPVNREGEPKDRGLSKPQPHSQTSTRPPLGIRASLLSLLADLATVFLTWVLLAQMRCLAPAINQARTRRLYASHWVAARRVPYSRARQPATASYPSPLHQHPAAEKSAYTSSLLLEKQFLLSHIVCVGRLRRTDEGE